MIQEQDDDASAAERRTKKAAALPTSRNDGALQQQITVLERSTSAKEEQQQQDESDVAQEQQQVKELEITNLKFPIVHLGYVFTSSLLLLRTRKYMCLQRLALIQVSLTTEDADELLSNIACSQENTKLLPHLDSVDLSHNHIESINFPRFLEGPSSLLQEINLYQNPCSFLCVPQYGRTVKEQREQDLQFVIKILKKHSHLHLFGWKKLFLRNRQQLLHLADGNRSRVRMFYTGGAGADGTNDSSTSASNSSLPCPLWPWALERVNRCLSNSERRASTFYDILRHTDTWLMAYQRRSLKA